MGVSQEVIEMPNYVSVGEYGIFVMPDFIRHHSKGGKHTFRGSLKRHLAIERVIYVYQRLIEDIIVDVFLFHAALEIPKIIAFGLNCNFPLKDVALYVSWYLRGCKPIAVLKRK